MSRSRKKNPVVAVACHARGSMKKWKKQCNSSFREMIKKYSDDFSIPHHRKYISRWTAPDDGKSFWYTPKGYRK